MRIYLKTVHIIAVFFIFFLSASSYGDKHQKIDVFADFIFWTASEAGADCWAEVIETDTSSFSIVQQAVVQIPWGHKVLLLESTYVSVLVAF